MIRIHHSNAGRLTPGNLELSGILYIALWVANHEKFSNCICSIFYKKKTVTF